jgi:hypothetical protein
MEKGKEHEMKHVRILGLAVVAAMAFMAFAGTASADVLCKGAPTKSGECRTATGDFSAGTTFKAISTNPKLTITGSFTAYLSCEESGIELKATSTGGNTPGSAVSVEITDLIFTGDCTTAGGSSCTISTTAGYTGTAKATNDFGGGAFTIFGSAIKTKIVCGGIFSCEYSPKAAGLTVDLTGGNPATVKASEEPLEEFSGFGCGSETTWDADYSLTGANTSLWVATKMD